MPDDPTTPGLDLAAAFGITPARQAREARRFLRPIVVPTWETDDPDEIATLAPPLLMAYLGAVLAWRGLAYAARVLWGTGDA